VSPRSIYRAEKAQYILDKFGSLDPAKLMCKKPKLSSFKGEVLKGRYFIIDYVDILSQVKAPVGKGLMGSMTGARLLLRRDDESKLMPVLIQLTWKKSYELETFYAVDYVETNTHTWQLAKMFFSFAEYQVQKFGFLYAETHCIVESIAVCMYRHLPEMHPYLGF